MVFVKSFLRRVKKSHENWLYPKEFRKKIVHCLLNFEYERPNPYATFQTCTTPECV